VKRKYEKKGKNNSILLHLDMIVTLMGIIEEDDVMFGEWLKLVESISYVEWHITKFLTRGQFHLKNPKR
jgi:hypothetical protein